MKSIERKLKADARAFAHEPNQNLQDNILEAINQIDVTRSANIATKGLWKILPVGLVFAMIVMGSFHLSSYKMNQLPRDTQLSLYAKPEDSVIYSLEASLTNPILKEQQNILSDLDYIKSLIAF